MKHIFVIISVRVNSPSNPVGYMPISMSPSEMRSINLAPVVVSRPLIISEDKMRLVFQVFLRVLTIGGTYLFDGTALYACSRSMLSTACQD